MKLSRHRLTGLLRLHYRLYREPPIRDDCCRCVGADRDIDYAAARAHLANQSEGLVEIASASDIPFDALSKQFTTKCGLNE